MKILTSLLTFVCFFSCFMYKTSANLLAQAGVHSANKQNVPIGGNSWVDNGAEITTEGLVNWSSPQSVCKTYLRVSQVGELKLSLLWKAQNGGSKIKVTILDKSIEISAQGSAEKEYFVGKWQLNEIGYVAISIQGIAKTASDFGILKSLIVSGSAISKDISYVKDNIDEYFYWGRRGPSVHLNFNTDELEDIEWFYSEIKVPQGNDVIGSYFMANGFGEGYFGMQVNSAEERKILFSVWSPYQTDKPEAIPDDQKIILLKKGKNVYSGEFGNEGSGGQSYLKYDWKVENTYKFLLKGTPTADGYTIYTAYFFANEENKWLLIASFKRPKTSTYLKGLYSFLENFDPEKGNIKRMAYYGNQWVLDTKGKWSELNNITFTADDTARKNFRKDYGGGVSGNTFYLKNCGFYNDFTPIDQAFTRQATKQRPVIDFLKLP